MARNNSNNFEIIIFLDIIHWELHCALLFPPSDYSYHWVKVLLCTRHHPTTSIQVLMVGMRGFCCCSFFWYTSTLCISLITSHLISATLHHPTQVVGLLSYISSSSSWGAQRRPYTAERRPYPQSQFRQQTPRRIHHPASMLHNRNGYYLLAEVS